MPFYADLHVHSKYSRATAKSSDLEHHALWARRKGIAVVGTGAAGLSAAWGLHRRHDVTLFEQDARPGGHVNTVVLEHGPDAGMPVDTGFIVMNEANYPNLVRLFGISRLPLMAGEQVHIDPMVDAMDRCFMTVGNFQ